MRVPKGPGVVGLGLPSSRRGLRVAIATLLAFLGSVDRAHGFLSTIALSGVQCRARCLPGINARSPLGPQGTPRQRRSPKVCMRDDAVSIRRAAPTGLTVGIPKERGSAHNRVAADPQTVERITASCGYSVIIESGAGSEAGHR